MSVENHSFIHNPARKQNMAFNIVDYGAIPNSDVMNTVAIQRAIDACHATGGGVVSVPAGTFMTGTLRLYSHITLCFESGAVLLGSAHFGDYPPIPFGWELYPATHALIYAIDETDVHIAGEGILDLNAKAIVLWDQLCTGLPQDQQERLTESQRASCHYRMPPRERRPNRLVFFHDCRNIDISGITVHDSPTWALVFSRCGSINIHDLRIYNHMQVPNSDGIHCCGCTDVFIRNCFIEAGDDCIAITGISDYGRVSERIVISGCILRSASSAVRIGFQASKVRDVILRDLIVKDSNRGVAIFAGDGGFVENISLSDLIMSTRIYPGPWWGKGEPLVICSATVNARIRHVSVCNVCVNAENSIIVSGEAGNVDDILLKNWRVALRYGDARPLYGEKIDLAPHEGYFAPDARKSIPWIQAKGVRQLATGDITVTQEPDDAHSFSTAPIIRTHDEQNG